MIAITNDANNGTELRCAGSGSMGKALGQYDIARLNED
eukprot:gene23904-10045_t